jgi:hypothetical protein
VIRPILVLLLLVLPAVAGAQVNRVPPVDRCASDRSFVAFRTQFRAAVAHRDRARLLAMVSNDFSDGSPYLHGPAALIARWRLDRPATSPLWGELDRALRLGCARDPEGQLWVPSMSLPDPDDPDDASYAGGAVAIVPGAALRTAPSERARVVARLYSDILAMGNDDDGHSRWVYVELDQHRNGYVRRSQIWSYTAWRAVFAKRRGQWRLTSFVLGD